MLWPVDTVNCLSLKRIRCLWEREKDATASSDITKPLLLHDETDEVESQEAWVSHMVFRIVNH